VAIPSQVAMGNLRLPAELHIVQGSAAQRTAAAAAAAQGKTTTSYRLQSGNTTHYQNSSYAVPSNQIYQVYLLFKMVSLLLCQIDVTLIVLV